MACADRVFHRMYAAVWPEISGNPRPAERLMVRWSAFVESFEEWAPVMDLVRGLAIGNEAFRDKYRQLLKDIVDPIAEELAAQAEQGPRRAMDDEFAGYVMMGMAEAGARLVASGEHDATGVRKYMESALRAQLLPD